MNKIFLEKYLFVPTYTYVLNPLISRQFDFGERIFPILSFFGGAIYLGVFIIRIMAVYLLHQLPNSK